MLADPDLELRTSRLRLRPVELRDALPTAALMNGGIAANLTTWPPQLSPAEARERIAVARDRLAARQALEMAILDRATDQLLGWVSIIVDSPKPHAASLGFWLGQPFQGQGLMIEAVRAVMPLAASFLRISAIEAHVYPWNSASIRLVRRLGFAGEGGVDLYSPIRRRNEEAFRYRLDPIGSKGNHDTANAA